MAVVWKKLALATDVSSEIDGDIATHAGLADPHTVYIKHILATAVNDFLVASGTGAFVKKTLAETLTILGKAAASGLASLDASSKVVQDPASAVSTATANKVVIRDANARAAFAAPSAAGDAAILSTVTDHAGLTTAHSAVSTATASRIVVRDSSARARFAAPAAAGDVLIKGTALTTTELPALTSGKIWQGDGSNRPVEVALPAGAIITTGTYSGDDTENRAIPHGLGVTPKLVVIHGVNVDAGRFHGVIFNADEQWVYSGDYITVTPWTTTNFYVSTVGAVNNLNVSGRTYYWVAIS